MVETEIDAAMSAYASGVDRSFAPLYRALRPRLSAYLAKRAGSPAVAEDLVQETFLRIHRARGTYRAGGAALAWVYAIARNVHLDHARAAVARQDLGVQVASTAAQIAPADAEERLIAHRAAAAGEHVLFRLPGTQRDAYLAVHRDGRSVRSAARRAGTTETALKLRCFRACEALRATLVEHLDVAVGRRGRHAGAGAALGH
jgi:RNA polymerase sigma-70 factor (ECF subfamily)